MASETSERQGPSHGTQDRNNLCLSEFGGPRESQRQELGLAGESGCKPGRERKATSSQY